MTRLVGVMLNISINPPSARYHIYIRFLMIVNQVQFSNYPANTFLVAMRLRRV